MLSTDLGVSPIAMFAGLILCLSSAQSYSAEKNSNPPFLELRDTDRRAFLEYRLTLAKLDRLDQFSKAAAEAYRRDARFRAEWKKYADTEAVTKVVAGNVALLESRYPRINSLLQKKGLHSSDAPLGIFSVMIGVWLVTEHSKNAITESRSYFPPENLTFVSNHLARCQALLDRLPKALD